MRSSWRIFLTIECLLLVLAVYQIIHNTPALIFLIFGGLNLVYSLKKSPRTSFNQFQLVLGIVVVILSLLTSGATVWIMVIIAVLYFGLKGVEATGVTMMDQFENAPWRKKQMMMIQTTETESKSGRRFKRPWIGNQRIGTNVYEWDDINFTIFSGDTIIDLGNTLLPKENNVIIIRKGFGRTRILVPLGVGLMLEHSTLNGNVIFEEDFFKLKNESLKVFSDDYDHNARKLKIVTNTLFGDLEVIRI